MAMNLSSQSTPSVADALHLSNLSDMSTVDMRRVAELVRQLAQARLEANRLQRMVPTSDGAAHPPAHKDQHSDSRYDVQPVVAAACPTSESSERHHISTLTGEKRPPTHTSAQMATSPSPSTATHALGEPSRHVSTPPASSQSVPPRAPADGFVRGTDATVHRRASAPVKHDHHWKQRYAAVKSQLRAERQQQENELHDIFALVEAITSEADHTRLRGENARLQRQVEHLLSRPDVSTAPTSASTSPQKQRHLSGSSSLPLVEHPLTLQSRAPACSEPPSVAVGTDPHTHRPPRVDDRPHSAVSTPDGGRLPLSSATHTTRPDDTLTAFLVQEVEAWRQRCLTLEKEKAQERASTAAASERLVSPDGLNTSTVPVSPSQSSPQTVQPPHTPAKATSPPTTAAIANKHLSPFTASAQPDEQQRLADAVHPALDPFLYEEEAQAQCVAHELQDQQRRHPMVPGGLTADYAAGSPHWHPHQISPARRRRHSADKGRSGGGRPETHQVKPKAHARHRVCSRSPSSGSLSVDAAASSASPARGSPNRRAPRGKRKNPARPHRHGRRRDNTHRRGHRTSSREAATRSSSSSDPSSYPSYSSHASSETSSRSSSGSASTRSEDRRGHRHRHRRHNHRHRSIRTAQHYASPKKGAKRSTRTKTAVTPAGPESPQSAAPPAPAPAPAPTTTGAISPTPPMPGAAAVPSPYLWFPGTLPAPYTRMPDPAGLSLWPHAAHPSLVPPPLPPAPPHTAFLPAQTEPNANIYHELLHWPLFTGPPPPSAPTLFATPYRRAPQESRASQPAPPSAPPVATYSTKPPWAVFGAPFTTPSDMVSSPPQWLTDSAAAHQPPWRAATTPQPAQGPAQMPKPRTPMPSTREQLSRDIARHDELLAAISTLQNAAAEQAFQRPRTS